MSAPKPVVLRITHRYEASAERVFDAWLDPAIARQFLFATPGGVMTRVEIDARVGGGFVIVEHREDGDAEHYGVYLEIDRPRRLVFAFSTDRPDPDAGRVIIEIARAGAGCELTLTHHMAPEWADYAERTRSGWASILGGLARIAGRPNDNGASS